MNTATTTPIRNRIYPRSRGYVTECSLRCQICNSAVSGPLQTNNHLHRDWWLCSECITDRDIRRVLDLLCWRRHPSQIPHCRECGRQVDPRSTRAHACIDWYFCSECYVIPAVRAKWIRLCDDLSR